jgi:anionic cell wall polymer biosynthesis LytR-Cps2A-Psr (LCP) family protein
MKKWVIFLIVAGFVASNMDSSKVKTENPPQETLSIIEQKTESPVKEEQIPSIKPNKRNFLFLSLENDKVKKAVVAKMKDDSKTMEVATLSKSDIEQVLSVQSNNIESISKDTQLKTNIESHLGVSIDHIIAVEKKGYLDLFSEMFPEGIPLQLTDEMKKDLNIEEQKEMYYVDGNEFLETIKELKQTQKYDQEINQLIIKTVTTQLYKPDVVLSLFGILNEMDDYFFTDLTMDEFLEIGLNAFRNPIQDVQKLEVPKSQGEEVMESKQSEFHRY